MSKNRLWRKNYYIGWNNLFPMKNSFRRGNKLFSILLILLGTAMIIYWVPLWVWFMILGIILIIVGVLIYK